MRDASLVVLTKYPDIFESFRRCAEALEPPPARMIVVVDGSDITVGGTRWTTIHGHQPFNVARSNNIGFSYVPEGHDIFGCSDDITFEPSTLGTLREILARHPDVGILAPRVFGLCGCALQCATDKEIRSDIAICQRAIATICTLIRWEAYKATGGFDEGFSGYGWDDTDFSLRVMAAGFKLAVTPLVTIRHGFGDVDGTVTFRRANPSGLGTLMDLSAAYAASKYPRGFNGA